MTKPSPQLDFDAILRNTHHRIRAYIAGMGVAGREVDDIAQAVYVELFRSLDDVPDDVAPQRWLKEIARDRTLHFLRGSARRGGLQRAALADILADTETDTHRQATEGTLALALEDCRRQLSEESRKLLELRYQNDLSSAAIAQANGSTAEATALMLFRIRASLQAGVARQNAGKA